MADFIKDSEFFKVRNDVFDGETLMTISKLKDKKIIKRIVREISVGKEANVFLGKDFEDNDICVKIYRIKTSEFKNMDKYLFGDPRFGNIRRNKRHIIFAWAQKEFSNLLTLTEHGVRVPYPIKVIKNVLVMEFLGENGEPFPKLKDNWDVANNFCEVLYENLKKMWAAKIIHADLSEYNILVDNNGLPIIIDLGTGVFYKHPLAMEFLQNDIRKVCKIFKRLGFDKTEEELYLEAQEILFGK
jgi:RIO kinase 1